MKNTRVLVILVVILLASSMFGCMTMKFEWAPEKVAILPFMNETADVTIPLFARAYLFERLQLRKKYEMIPIADVDAVLNEMGITDGGQLSSTTVTELSQKLDADGIVYGDVLQAKRVKLALYFENTFECHYMMYRGSDESVQWDETRRSSERKLVISSLADIGAEMLKSVAEDAIMKAFNNHPLKKHIEKVTKVSLYTFPVM
jgi:hypothetical protein